MAAKGSCDCGNGNCGTKMKEDEGIYLSMDPLTKEESKEDFTPISKNDEKSMVQLIEMLNQEQVKTEDSEFFQKARKLVDKYPNNPKPLYILACGLQIVGREDEMETIVIETHQKFPNYLFGKMELIQHYLEVDKIEEAFQIINGAQTLKQMQPDRTVFHVSEFVTFHDLLVQHFCIKKDFDNAVFHLQMLNEVLEDDDPDFRDAVMVLFETFPDMIMKHHRK